MTADANIVIGIKGDLNGAKTIKRSLDDINASANTTTGTFKRFEQQVNQNRDRLRDMALQGKAGSTAFQNLKVKTDNMSASLRKADRAARDVNDEIKKTSRSAQLFGRALGAIGGIFVVRALGTVSDEFTVLDTSIRNVTDGTEEYDRVFNSLFQTAQDNGDVFSGLASTYQKLNVSLEDSVKNSTDLTKVTEILSRGFAASGTNAQTAAGASLQLTQGLATNFQAAGQELNSIIEGAPLLAKAIAVELGGKGATDLKRFAQEGTLTAQTFLDALIAAEDAVKAFEVPTTIGRSIQRVRNEFVRLTGQSETMRAVSIGVAEGFNFVARNMDVMFKIMAVGFGAFAGYIIATQGLTAAMTVASGAVGVFNAVLLANPIGAFIAILAAAGIAAYTFRDEIEATIIVAVTEIIIFVDKAIAKLKEFKNFATNGIAAASIGAQNAVGLISDDVAQSALLELGNQNGSVGTTFDAAALRAEAQNQLLGLANKKAAGSTPGFTPTGSGGVTSTSGSGSSSRSKGQSQQAKDLQNIIKNTRTEQEGLIAEIKNLNNLRGFAKTAEEVTAIDRALAVANQELQTASTAIPGLDDQFSSLRDRVDSFGDAAGNAFGEIITGATSAKDAISNLLTSTAQSLASEGFSGLVGGLLNGFGGDSGGGLIGAITGSLGGSGGVGSLFGFNSGGDMVLGGAGGIDNNVLSLNGSPIANTSRGETMSIRPAGTSGNGSGTVQVYQTINVSTGVQETVQAELVAFLPTIEKTTKAAIAQDKQRGITS